MAGADEHSDQPPAMRLVVVAVDGSAFALNACRQAAKLATSCGAAIHAVHAAAPSLPGLTISVREARESEGAARAFGERVVDEARVEVGSLAPFTGEVVFGPAVEVICGRAAELGADLVVVGSRGLGAVDRFLLGSASSAVVTRCSCSVLVHRVVQERGTL